MDFCLKKLLRILEDAPVINLIGKAGTGKSSLAQFLIGNVLMGDKASSCTWIQASDSFAIERIKRFFSSPSILSRFFAYPKTPINSFNQQIDHLTSIINQDTLLPPRTRFIVIDNISHHLRTEILDIPNIREKRLYQNRFFNDCFFPMFMFALREGLTLFLIHEVSYNPKLDKEVAFFHSLYDKVEAVNIILKKDVFSNARLIEINTPDIKLSMRYEIHTSHFYFEALDNPFINA